MQKRLNINGRILSLTEPPASHYCSAPAQEWCQQQLDSGHTKPVVWFLKDAVYHVLRPQADTARASGFYSTWKSLHSRGVRLFVCQSACRRRLPAGSVNEDLFEISTLTRWADDFAHQLDDSESGVCCIIGDQPPGPGFIRESIDPVLSLLAMEIPVNVIFTAAAKEHLLNEVNWRKWRMLPETEERVRLIVQGSEVNDEERQLLLSRQGVQLLAARDYAGLVENGSCVYV